MAEAQVQREICSCGSCLVDLLLEANPLTVKCETQSREREDDEIIEALNRYTAKLQDSLKVITSPDA